MGYGSASPLKQATVAGFILLVLAVSMGSPLVKADCISSCITACSLYADALCSGFNSDSCTHPLPLGETCKVAAIQPCGATCVDGCTAGQLAGCIV